MIRGLPMYPAPVRSAPVGIAESLRRAVVAYYPGDGSELDFIGGNHGVLQGTGTTYVEGPYGGRMWRFDGNGWVTAPHMDRPDPRVFTLIATVKDLVSATESDLFTEFNSSNSAPANLLRLVSTSARYFYRTDAGVSTQIIGNTITGAARQWIAATGDGTTLRLFQGVSADTLAEVGNEPQPAGTITFQETGVGRRISTANSPVGSVGECTGFKDALPLDYIKAWAAGLQGVHYA